MGSNETGGGGGGGGGVNWMSVFVFMLFVACAVSIVMGVLWYVKLRDKVNGIQSGQVFNFRAGNMTPTTVAQLKLQGTSTQLPLFTVSALTKPAPTGSFSYVSLAIAPPGTLTVVLPVGTGKAKDWGVDLLNVNGTSLLLEPSSVMVPTATTPGTVTFNQLNIVNKVINDTNTPLILQLNLKNLYDGTVPLTGYGWNVTTPTQEFNGSLAYQHVVVANIQ
jgi:hypothetical protein